MALPASKSRKKASGWCASSLGSEHAGGSTGGAIADVLLFQHQHAQTGHGALIGDRTADDTGANHENFR